MSDVRLSQIPNALLYGLQHLPDTWQGQQDDKAVARRRARNKAARVARRINRRNH